MTKREFENDITTISELQALLSELQDIPTGYDYYRYDDGEWSGVDDYDFQDLKDEVEEWMDEWGRWDEEEPDEDEPPHYAYTPTAEDKMPPVQTGCALENVIGSSGEILTVKHTQDGIATPLPLF